MTGSKWLAARREIDEPALVSNGQPAVGPYSTGMAKRFAPPDQPPLLEGRLTAHDGSGAVLIYSIWRPEPAPDIDYQCHVRIVREQHGHVIADRPIYGVDELQALALACNLIEILAGRDARGP